VRSREIGQEQREPAVGAGTKQLNQGGIDAGEGEAGEEGRVTEGGKPCAAGIDEQRADAESVEDGAECNVDQWGPGSDADDLVGPAAGQAGEAAEPARERTLSAIVRPGCRP
jgi:hypothetical protein